MPPDRCGPGGRVFDLAVIGGGVNGAGIARDAAGRGLRVLLCEQSDLAAATSSASTKLIHGGLRYLEYFEFGLVRKALREREVLLCAAPHIIWPLRFVLPHHRILRPFWMLRLGLFLYDHMGGRRILPPTSVLDLRHSPAGAPLKDEFTRGFEYSDCWVEDSRLVVLNALDAAERGADIRTRTRCRAAVRREGLWELTLEDADDGRLDQVHARVLVNATGPWVSRFLGEVVRTNAAERVRLVKGSHLVMRRLFDHDRCYIFQNRDGRIVFAIPYEGDYTLIGTTDEDYDGDLADVRISDAEIDYLIAAAGAYFKRPLDRADIVWTYAGVRPLYDDGATEAKAATRDYVLTTDGGGDRPLLVNVFGGKITTFRKLAETVLEKVRPSLPHMTGPWTHAAPLPGGDFPHDGFERLVAQLRWSYPFLGPDHARRLVRLYGTRARELLGAARNTFELGRHFGADLYECEVRYLVRREFARTADDILWRRTRLGLQLTRQETETLASWLRDNARRLAVSTA